MNDADREIVERLKRFRQQDAADLIESQAAEIERHREAALESTGLAGERIGTIAALRHEVADQAKRIEELGRSLKTASLVVKNTADTQERLWKVHSTAKKLVSTFPETMPKEPTKFDIPAYIVEELRTAISIASQAAAVKETSDA